MIITRMRMKDFFRYRAESLIDFVSHNEKNVTVLIGENGRGKTTLLNAFSWCFYGVLEEPLNLDLMFNKKSRSELSEGDIANSFVEIEFEDNKMKYSIRREVGFKKKNGDMVRISDDKCSVKYYDQFGNPKSIDDQKDFFNRIIPVKLRKFFFFDGEKINRLAQIDGREEIKEAILNLLGLNVIENLKKDLQNVDLKLTKEINKYLKDNDKELTSKIEDLSATCCSYEELIKKARIKLSEMKNQELEISDFLQKHNSTTISKLETETIQLTKEVDLLKIEIQNIGRLLNKELSGNAKKQLIQSMFTPVKQLLEDKRKKGELPSDIKGTFIDDLIERKKCICGRDISENSEELIYLQEVRKTAGKSELDDAYTRIMSLINSVSEDKNQYFDRIDDLIEQESNKFNLIKIKEKRINDIEIELKSVNIDEINAKLEFRTILKSKIYDAAGDLKVLENTYKDSMQELTNKNNELDKIELNNLEAQKINSYKNKVKMLIALNSEVNESFKEDVRQDLDKRIKQIFKSISHKDYRQPELTEDLLLKVVNSFNEKKEDEVLSTGENQIASLSFIGALVSYSRDKQNSELLSSFMGGDFPIVMDSPFGNLDSTHSSHVAKGIADLSSQVIVIVSEKQWSHEVKTNIYERVGKMYFIKEGPHIDEIKGEYSVIDEVQL